MLYISAAPLSPATSAALVAVFVVIFIVSRQALGQTNLFSGGTRTPISLCVALLSVLSIGPAMTDVILLPYLALVVCAPFLFLLWLLDRRSSGAEVSERPSPRELGPPDRGQAAEPSHGEARRAAGLLLDSAGGPEGTERGRGGQ